MQFPRKELLSLVIIAHPLLPYHVLLSYRYDFFIFFVEYSSSEAVYAAQIYFSFSDNHLLCFILISSKRVQQNQSASDSGYIAPDSISFEEYTSLLFQSEVTSDTLTLHYTLSQPEVYGITDYKIALPDYSADARKQSALNIEISPVGYSPMTMRY